MNRSHLFRRSARSVSLAALLATATAHAQTTPVVTPAVPAPVAANPVADLTQRVAALEAQLRTMTNEAEQTAFKLRTLEREHAALKAAYEQRFPPAPTAPAPVSVQPTPGSEPAPTTPSSASPAPTPSTAPVTPAPSPAITPQATPAPVATPRAPSSAERLARVRAVPIPSTGNEAEDTYSYGFRLWQAGLYPEAQTELKRFMTSWPKHRRASFASNLLGRAYLDDAKPSLAVKEFYANYAERPAGERAPHSLMYMGVALDRLNRKADACRAFKELDDVYGQTMPADVRADAARARTAAGC